MNYMNFYFLTGIEYIENKYVIFFLISRKLGVWLMSYEAHAISFSKLCLLITLNPDRQPRTGTWYFLSFNIEIIKRKPKTQMGA